MASVIAMVGISADQVGLYADLPLKPKQARLCTHLELAARAKGHKAAKVLAAIETKCDFLP
jgi:hypothetical protein